ESEDQCEFDLTRDRVAEPEEREHEKEHAAGERPDPTGNGAQSQPEIRHVHTVRSTRRVNSPVGLTIRITMRMRKTVSPAKSAPMYRVARASARPTISPPTSVPHSEPKPPIARTTKPFSASEAPRVATA